MRGTRARQCVIRCDCGGFLRCSSLTDDAGNPVLFWVTEDERILFRGYCTSCHQDITFTMPLMELLFSCPREVR